VFLPSVAERHRRAVLLSVGVTVLTLQAVLQLTLLEALARAVTAPLAQLTMPLAGWVVEKVSPAPAQADQAPLSGDALIQAERLAGQPAPVPGVAWLEVPVGLSQPEAGRMLLAAGTDFGLAKGMPVVYGGQWLGRIGRTGSATAEVELLSGAARRTPAVLDGDRGAPLRAVLEGRGGIEQPIVRWLEAKGEPIAASSAYYRRGATDPPVYAALDLRIGSLLRVGDPDRGSAAWEVDFVLPAGAEGRVFVAAGAVSDTVIAEPPIQTASASLALRADGVFGSRLCGLRAASELSASIAMVDGRVLGRVVARRGELLWCSRRAPADWPSSTWVGLDEDTATREDAELRFTRGGVGIPRGLFLGSRQDSAPSPVGELRLLGRVPLSEPDA
jgi:hypothetical protein